MQNVNILPAQQLLWHGVPQEWQKRLKSIKSFNNILLEENMKWELPNNDHNKGYLAKFDLKIEAISTKLVSRPYESDLIIYHPYLSSNHQLLKIITLYKRLKKSNEVDKFILNHFKKVIYNPLNWITSTLGWIKVLYFKLLIKLKKSYLRD